MVWRPVGYACWNVDHCHPPGFGAAAWRFEIVLDGGLVLLWTHQKNLIRFHGEYRKMTRPTIAFRVTAPKTRLSQLASALSPRRKYLVRGTVTVGKSGTTSLSRL